MAITQYSELKTAVDNWLHRTDLTSRVPEFIVYAESLIANDPDPSDPNVLPGIRCKEMITRATATLDEEYEDMPTGYLGMVDFKVTTEPEHYLKFIHPSILTQKYPTANEGTPIAYTIKGSQFQFRNVPTSTDTYTAELAYYKRFTSFSADADTNWLLTNHPFVYLYGALIAAAPHLRDSNDYSIWRQEYLNLVEGINKTEKRQKYGSTLAMRTTGQTP